MLQLSQAKLQITMFCREWPYNGLYHLHSAHTDPTKHWTDIGYNFLWFYKNIINNKHLLYSNTDWTALSHLTVYLSSSSSAMGITPSSYFIMLLDLLDGYNFALPDYYLIIPDVLHGDVLLPVPVVAAVDGVSHVLEVAVHTSLLLVPAGHLATAVAAVLISCNSVLPLHNVPRLGVQDLLLDPERDFQCKYQYRQCRDLL